MKQLTYSDRSLLDLESIIDFIARDKPNAAISFTDKLIETCELIAKNPELGERREDLSPSLRLFSYRGYGIYYRILASEVRIERFLNSSLDAQQQSFD